MSKIDNNKIKISGLEYLYDNGKLSKSDTLRNIPLKELFTFRDHPFLVVDDEKMEETVESIRKYGVINPGIARPRKGGGYELISGHRRKRALAEMHKLMGQETNKKKTEFDEKFENEEWLPEALELAEKKDNLSSFYRWLEDENYIFKSPLRRIYKIKTRKVVKEAFSDEKIEILQYGLNQVE